MWIPLVKERKISSDDLQSLLSGKTPAVIIKNFYSKNTCKMLAQRIFDSKQSSFHDNKLMHIGPFLMSYTTRKKDYFDDAKEYRRNIDYVFSGIQKPRTRLQKILRNDISVANELQNQYSECIIRIHEKGKEVPIHKDNVRYEGIEYDVAKINGQLSCIIHIQESEIGGELVIYDKQWSKQDERFRDIEFGYTDEAIESANFCKLEKITSGDAVIINPNFYHQVTRIQGNSPRITIGMFLGIYNDKMIAWA